MDTSKRQDQNNPIVLDGGKPFLSRVFEALKNQRRRYILYYLREHKQASTDDLADQLVAWEQDIPINDVSTENTKQVKTSLIHTHLPKLDDYGLVEYDQRTEAISYTHPPPLLEKALEFAAAIESPP